MTVSLRKAHRLLGALALDGMLSVTGMTASSFHAVFEHKPAWEVRAVVEVLDAPAPTDDLVFWALQVDVEGRDGRTLGGVHLGLQHYSAHPGARAVNFGGYRADGAELAGTVSSLPSATGNPNTRDFLWRQGQRYELTVRLAKDAVVGLVDGKEVRRLRVPGATRLVRGVVWTEDFRGCGADPVTVRWSGLKTNRQRITAVETRYQADGCTDTSTEPDGRAAIVQRTATSRQTAPATQLQLL